MKNISSVQRKMVGISFLTGKVAETISSVWAERFMSSDALLIESKPDITSEQLLDKIYSSIELSGMHISVADTCIFAVFYDLTLPSSIHIAEMLDSITLRFSSQTMASVMTQVVQFGYLGIKGGSSDRNKLLENTQAIINSNNHPLCLVSTMILDRECNDEWKAVSIYLDILRRDSALTAAPVGYRVGYLKYGEYDDDKIQDLLAEIERFQAILGRGGQQEITARVTKLLQDIETQSSNDTRFYLKAQNQPLHPATRMPKPKFWGKDAWLQAAAISCNAIIETGKMLKERIINEYSISETDAIEKLKEILRDSGAGCGLVGDNDAINLALDIPLPRRNDPLPLVFADSILIPQIQEYFDAWRSSGLYTVKSDSLKKLKLAIPSLQGLYKKQENEWQNKLNSLRQELGLQTSVDDFLGSAASNGNKMKWSFQVTNGEAKAAKYIICRNEEDVEMVKSVCDEVGINTYYIDKENGSLINQDKFEIKAVHAVYFSLCIDSAIEVDPVLSQMIV